jgi:hypothetical protein
MSLKEKTGKMLPTITGDVLPSITNMMLLRDKSRLNLFETDVDDFQQNHARAGLPGYFQKAFITDSEKLAAFLPTFFEKTARDLHYAYKIFYANRDVTLTVSIQNKPETAEDFYVLAVAINHHYQNIVITDEQGEAIDDHVRKAFIYSLLQEAALTGHAAAKKTLAKIQNDAQINNYIALSRFDFLYSYKISSKFLLTTKPPIMAEEFFELANQLLNGYNGTFAQGLLFIHRNHKMLCADMGDRDDLIYSLLGDAAKAGHHAAKEQLIAATIAGNRRARDHVTFSRFNNLPILLPRPFVTAADFRKLATSLIVHGKNILETSCLEGPFYIVENGAIAERLGYALLAEAKKLAKMEEEVRLAKAYKTDDLAQPTVVEVTESKPLQQDANWIATYHNFFSSPGVKGRSLLSAIEFEEESATADSEKSLELPSSPRL